MRWPRPPCSLGSGEQQQQQRLLQRLGWGHRSPRPASRQHRAPWGCSGPRPEVSSPRAQGPRRPTCCSASLHARGQAPGTLQPSRPRALPWAGALLQQGRECTPAAPRRCLRRQRRLLPTRGRRPGWMLQQRQRRALLPACPTQDPGGARAIMRGACSVARSVGALQARTVVRGPRWAMLLLLLWQRRSRRGRASCHHHHHHHLRSAAWQQRRQWDRPPQPLAPPQQLAAATHWLVRRRCAARHASVLGCPWPSLP